ncbi:hypothetical protein [Geomicrobium sp. JCM 19038]|uniref:hypothetical protein n=1 Tax=Geomicrobium sp. JCM 19038 TaxID=1460635 RepID=UPI00045F10C7|nr:hypothetical protein [Geomicrobium sp. JCM 19038]GAK08431.1 hypothetical protein JCM19038_2214 [Geomicrobium sp. JCM 19038]
MQSEVATKARRLSPIQRKRRREAILAKYRDPQSMDASETVEQRISRLHLGKEIADKYIK